MADIFDLILQGIGAPDSENNRNTMLTWAMREDNTLQYLVARNNPLATTQDAPGATSLNSVGVRIYPDANTGATATVQTLLNGFYDPIVALLRADAPITDYAGGDVGRAFSTWSGGGYDNLLGIHAVAFTAPAGGGSSAAVSAPTARAGAGDLRTWLPLGGLLLAAFAVNPILDIVEAI